MSQSGPTKAQAEAIQLILQSPGLPDAPKKQLKPKSYSLSPAPAQPKLRG